jgi:hypothetical protein
MLKASEYAHIRTTKLTELPNGTVPPLTESSRTKLVRSDLKIK